MTDRQKWQWMKIAEGFLRFFLDALFAKLLWNGVGHSLLGLPPITYVQMLGLSILVVLILPTGKLTSDLLQELVFDKDGKRRP